MTPCDKILDTAAKDLGLNKKTARWALPLRIWAFLLLLVVVVPLGGAGCGFGPQVPVPDNPQVALQEGRAKEKAADERAAAKETEEAGRLNNEAVAYYGAAARKFAGSRAGLEALLAQAQIYETDLQNPTQAQQTYRNALRQYPPASFPELNQEAQRRYDALVQRMDRENARTPYYQAMDALVRLMGGNAVLAIFAISIGVTLALWPLRAKQYRGMKEMQRHQPELKKIQEKYKDDRQLQQEKTMEFFKEHGYNPMAGCLPMLAQMPVLWLLYHAISLYQFQFARSTFLWISPALGGASMDWSPPFTGAIARNLGEQDLPLLFVYALSMYFQTKLTPAADPAQAEQQKIMAIMMPAMFFIMMLQWHLPSAFVLYWFLSNVLMVAQQWYINRSIHLPPLPATAAAAAVSGGGDGAADGGANGSSVPGNGTGAPAAPLARSQKLISQKNRKKRVVRRK